MGLQIAGGVAATVVLAFAGFWFFYRYATSPVMIVPIKEYSPSEYPEDPGDRSIDYGRYSGRYLKLVERDATHFDFIFESKHSYAATIEFNNIDVALMTPGVPTWTKGDPNLERIALTDRQWNRQQVSFARGSEHLEVSGGNGFERDHLIEADLAKNCLNAGLWEVLLYDREDGRKTLYYHGWFTFPLGYYKTIFEHNTGMSYWKHWHWYELEHWSDPAGLKLNLARLRTVLDERTAPAKFLSREPIFAYGEQRAKLRALDLHDLLTWGDFAAKAGEIRFPTFAPPGRYFVSKPWKNEYWRLAKFNKAILRDVKSPASDKPLLEIELDFTNGRTGEPTRFIVSGIDVQSLPQLDISDYPKGLYMPMGIGVPPFFQSYDELERNRPDKSPYFSVLLDGRDRWINHHEVAIDGPVLHRDKFNPNLLHLYLLSYERHTLIGHYVIALNDKTTALAHREKTPNQPGHVRQ
ncbi:MAG: hypothetical protein ACRD19_16185 [Terriglobia bacterium]